MKRKVFLSFSVLMLLSGLNFDLIKDSKSAKSLNNYAKPTFSELVEQSSKIAVTFFAPENYISSDFIEVELPHSRIFYILEGIAEGMNEGFGTDKFSAVDFKSLPQKNDWGNLYSVDWVQTDFDFIMSIYLEASFDYILVNEPYYNPNNPSELESTAYYSYQLSYSGRCITGKITDGKVKYVKNGYTPEFTTGYKANYATFGTHLTLEELLSEEKKYDDWLDVPLNLLKVPSLEAAKQSAIEFAQETLENAKK